jgi:hypothetical protein
LRGRVREGGNFTRGVNYDLQDAATVSQHIGIPKSEYAISFGCQPTIALRVALRFRMLATINFDHELFFVTCKIDNK